VRGTRDGALYDSRFGERMRGKGAYANLIAQRFEAARSRHGLRSRPAPLDPSLFRPPRDTSPQLGLFDDSGDDGAC